MKDMGWSYKGLWIKLIEKDLKRMDLKRIAGINSYTLARMGKSEPVHLEVIGKICQAFHCRLADIVEYIPEPETDDEEKNREE